MTAYTSSGSGNWNTAATWGGSGYPQTGDTATIANGHTITIPVSTTSTCGAVTFNSGTGKLIVNGTWNLGGNVTLNGGGNIIEANGAFIIDLNGYSIDAAGADIQYNFLGLVGSRGTVRSTGSAGTVTNPSTYKIIPTFAYTDFNGIGDAIWGRSQTDANAYWTVQYCTFTDCQRIAFDQTGVGANAGFLVKGCSFINPRSADPESASDYQPYILIDTTTIGTRQRVIEDCIWTTNGSINNVMYIWAQGLICRRNVFDNVDINSAVEDVIFHSNFFSNTVNTGDAREYFHSSGGRNRLGTFVNNYCYYDGYWHPFGFSNADAVMSIYGNILDNQDGGMGTNWVLFNTCTGTTKYKNNIALGTGIMTTFTGNGAPTLLEIDKNLFYGSNNGTSQGGSPPSDFSLFLNTEQASTLTGTVKVRSNFGYNPDTATNAWDHFIDLMYNTANQIDAATNNYGYGSPGGSHTPTYGANVTTPTPGTNDGSANPQFVSAGRNLKTWCSTRGYGSATFADALAAVKANTSRIPDLVNWCFEGYEVQNATLRTVAHDGYLVGPANYRDSTRSTTFISSLKSTAGSSYSVSV